MTGPMPKGQPRPWMARYIDSAARPYTEGPSHAAWAEGSAAVRGGIVAAPATKLVSQLRQERHRHHQHLDVAPPGLGACWGVVFYKDAAPDGAGRRPGLIGVWLSKQALRKSGGQSHNRAVKFDHSRYLERRRTVRGEAVEGKVTRVPARSLWVGLAEGAAAEGILADCPTVTRKALQAMGTFVAALAGEVLPMPPVPVTA